MDSRQLVQIMSELCGSRFHGVYASSDLAHLPMNHEVRSHDPWGIIVNTGTWASKGEHWTAICSAGDSLDHQVDYFCSYGTPPTAVKNIHSFLNKFAEVIYNPHQLQSLCSSFCGHYVILFLLSRLVYDLSYTAFLNQFNTNDRQSNDRVVMRP